MSRVQFLHCEGIKGWGEKKDNKVLLFSSSLLEFLVK